jgi:hypothetical protein
MRLSRLIPAALLATLALPAFGDVTILVSGSPVRRYDHRGVTYIEALRGRDFTIRLTNPTPHRVAVALSVDGLNTIDAKHTSAWNASKWILGPYETADIEGWQVSDRTARRFFFTGERSSYGAALGRTANLGIIEAVFYRERRPIAREYSRRDQEGTEAAPPSAEAAPRSGATVQPKDSDLSDDHAATGMGGRTRHDVERVSIDLDPHPIRTFAIRYEFRPQLVKLGVLPASPSPIERRERARGFSEYCPEPD